MHRKLLILLLLCLCIVARGQAVYEYRYWFDGDESTMHTGTSTDDAWQMDFDIGSLDASFHIVHLIFGVRFYIQLRSNCCILEAGSGCRYEIQVVV